MPTFYLTDRKRKSFFAFCLVQLIKFKAKNKRIKASIPIYVGLNLSKIDPLGFKCKTSVSQKKIISPL